MATYVLLGSPKEHRDYLEELAAEGSDTNWTINAEAQIGDTVLFYLTGPLSVLFAR